MVELHDDCLRVDIVSVGHIIPLIGKLLVQALWVTDYITNFLIVLIFFSNLYLFLSRVSPLSKDTLINIFSFSIPTWSRILSMWMNPLPATAIFRMYLMKLYQLRWVTTASDSWSRILSSRLMLHKFMEVWTVTSVSTFQSLTYRISHSKKAWTTYILQGHCSCILARTWCFQSTVANSNQFCSMAQQK